MEDDLKLTVLVEYRVPELLTPVVG